MSCTEVLDVLEVLHVLKGETSSLEHLEHLEDLEHLGLSRSRDHSRKEISVPRYAPQRRSR